MAAIAASFLQYSIKAVIFALLAFAGIRCGRKFRDSRDAKKTAEVQAEN